MRKNALTWTKDTFFINGEEKRLIIADMHYYRLHHADWEQRLDLAVDFGINVIQTYVPWNAHEPREGCFDFTGMLDLAAFLELAQKKGLYVFLRPSPYVCCEWEWGGLPAWLLKDKELVIRTSDERYMSKVRAYYKALVPQFLPYMGQNGGPILAVCLENEYGSYGNDKAYISGLKSALSELGVEGPYYTTDGTVPHMLEFGPCDGDFFGVNYRAAKGENEPNLKALREKSDTNPCLISEYWVGRSMHWGEPFRHRPPEDVSEPFAEALQMGANVTMYMFAGGTNFGFMGGANYGYSFSPRAGTPMRFIPHLTSYDVDALVSECGNPTEKYYQCRDALDAFLGKPLRPHGDIPRRKTQAATVPLTDRAALFDNVDALTTNIKNGLLPATMEEMGENYGLMLYTTELSHLQDEYLALKADGIKDRCSLFLNGKWFSTQMRDRSFLRAAATDEQRGYCGFYSVGDPITVTALVENLGRVNYGWTMPHERKGLSNPLLIHATKLFGYESRTLPLSDLSEISWQDNSGAAPEKQPYFYKGTFAATTDADTFVCFENFSHGYIWLNGFNLGRYDSAGPQMTLYVPKGLLQAQNEIIVLDILSDGEKKVVELLDREILEGESQELV